MPAPKLLVLSDGLEAQFRLIPDDEEEEEGQLPDDDEDDEDDEDAEEKSDEDDNNQSSQDEGNTHKSDKKVSQTDRNDGQDEKEEEKGTSQNGNHKESASKGKKLPQISLFEMQSFLVALILPEPRLSTPPTWCRVIRCTRAPNVGIFLLDEADLDWIENKGSKFTHAFRFDASPNWIEQLTSVPLSRRMQNMTQAPRVLGAANGIFEPDLNAMPKMSKISLLLSPIQMLVESYPMPTDENIKVLRSKYYPVEDSSPMFAIDCEMCITNQSELTKISIVDEELRVVYNELVKPPNPITNYLTRYSGITAAMMENVTTTLEDVQYFMRKNLPRDAIFCGHSLNMDLAAIQIFHPYVIDTSVIYNRTGIRSYKPSLKSLAYDLMGKAIQTFDKIGHDSLEDAITTMELIKLKLVNGPLFCDQVSIEASQGLKYDSKTGITHLQIDKFIERHDSTPLSYRTVDTSPGVRCLYVHDKQEPLDQDVKDSILYLLEKKMAICVILTSAGECYIKF